MPASAPGRAAVGVEPMPAGARWRAGLELAAGLLLFELDVWLLRMQADAFWHAAALTALAGVFLASARRRGRALPGPPRLTLRRAWTETLGVTALLATGLTLAAPFVRDPWELGASAEPGIPWLTTRAGIALGQQAALQLFLAPLCAALVGRPGVAMLLAAAVFGLVHLPSPILVALSGGAALVWLGLYRRHGRLAPLVVTHLLLSSLLQLALPDRLHYGMQVGGAALPYRAHADRRAELSALYERLAEAREEPGADRVFVDWVFREALGRAPTAMEHTVWGRALREESRSKLIARLLWIRSQRTEATRVREKEHVPRTVRSAK